ncbi:hypothetical protein CEQ90_01200 [Lewinellaceae bacterium SD302]|nr:hypothetical protein CEQ90_01200 [Lewinellaceae bacterium SD302]
MKFTLKHSGFYLLLLCLFFTACGEDNRDAEWGYEKALAKGLRSNERTDQLLLDLKFGMTGAEVSRHFDRLSAEQSLEVTPAGYSTDFDLPELPGETTLNVLPVFTDEAGGKLYALDFTIVYNGEMQSSKKSFVVMEVTKEFRLRYGADFFVLRDEQQDRTIVQVKNNRRLAFWRGPGKNVTGRFVDLSVAPREPLRPAGNDRPQMGMNSISERK